MVWSMQTIALQWDLSVDATSKLRSAGNELQELIMVRQYPPLRDTNIAAAKVRDYMKGKFFEETNT